MKLKNFLLVIVSFIFSFMLIDLFLIIFRLAPSRKIVQFDEKLGWRNEKNVNLELKSCVGSNNFKTNKYGYRGGNWSIKKDKFRIAVLGDSFVEGNQVKYENNFTSLLEENLEVEVLNFGVSGYSTVNQIPQYINEVAKFNPELIILGFLPYNDFHENHVTNQPCINKDNPCNEYWPKPKIKFISSDKVILSDAILNNNILLIKKFLYDLSPSLRVINKFYKKSTKKYLSSNEFPIIEKNLQIYKKPINEKDFDFWKTTEKYLIYLNKIINLNNSNLLIIVLPDIIPFFKNIESVKLNWPELQIDQFSNYDLRYPYKRIKKFANENGLTYKSLLEDMNQYVLKKDINYPYYSHICDIHWSELGHKIAAAITSKYLIENGLVNVKDKELKLLKLGKILE